MKVISKFHDYYDPVLRMFQEEQTPLYLRKEEIVPDWKYIRQEFDYRLSRIGYNNSIGAAITIGYCGKIYPAYEVSTGNYSEYEYIYDPIKLEEIAEENNASRKWFSEKAYKEIFEIHKLDKQYLEIFEKYQTPCFMIRNNKTLTLNPSLKKLNFGKVIDPYTAVQELDIYLSSGIVKGGTTEPLSMSDEVLRNAKGFNDKSFKSDPGLKKLKRAENKKRKNKNR